MSVLIVLGLSSGVKDGMFAEPASFRSTASCSRSLSIRAWYSSATRARSDSNSPMAAAQSSAAARNSSGVTPGNVHGPGLREQGGMAWMSKP